MKRSVSVVIPNYNGKHLLEKYLPSVYEALQNAEITYEIIIVDDCSTDSSVDFIKSTYTESIILENDQNSGFSFTCNRGIGIAKMELTLLLNSDVKLTARYFEDQCKYFDLADTFGVMGRIMSQDGQKIEDAARLLYFKGCRIKANRFYYSKDPDCKVYTAYLSGANALVNTAKLKELGGFDEIFSPFTSEDFDLSLRAWQMGWKCYYEHSSICYHQVSGSIRTQLKSNFIYRVYFRNRWIVNKIHLSNSRAFLLPLAILGEVIYKTLLGKFWILKSLQDYLKLSKNIKSSRSRLESLKSKQNSALQLPEIIELINSPSISEHSVFL